MEEPKDQIEEVLGAAEEKGRLKRRLERLRHLEWVERLERNLGMRGRAHPPTEGSSAVADAAEALGAVDEMRRKLMAGCVEIRCTRCGALLGACGPGVTLPPAESGYELICIYCAEKGKAP